MIIYPVYELPLRSFSNPCRGDVSVRPSWRNLPSSDSALWPPIPALDLDSHCENRERPSLIAFNFKYHNTLRHLNQFGHVAIFQRWHPGRFAQRSESGVLHVPIFNRFIADCTYLIVTTDKDVQSFCPNCLGF